MSLGEIKQFLKTKLTYQDYLQVDNLLDNLGG